MAALTNPPRTKTPYELKKGQNRLFHKLPSGLKMEVIEQRRSKSERENPPLVFVHGSYHAAWCWAEHWLPFFSSSGVKVMNLWEQLLEHFRTHCSILLGIYCKQAVVRNGKCVSRTFRGCTCLLGSTFGGLVLHYLFSKHVAAFKVTLSLAAKGFQKSIPLCRETFFSQAMDDQLVKRYQDLMTESSRMPLFDLRKLNASLPVPKPMENSTKVLVLGAKDDFIVDDEGLKETGWFYCVEPVCIEGVAHDMMLDCSWKKGAEVLLSWLCGLFKPGNLSA
ncbi:unnamed protein product [Arabidopsis lyrata]|nr:unnamed protein product [Arabidopsis lyrata]